MSTLLKDLIEEKGVLLADGATGSNLFGMGLELRHYSHQYLWWHTFQIKPSPSR